MYSKRVYLIVARTDVSLHKEVGSEFLLRKPKIAQDKLALDLQQFKLSTIID